jgi:hypothetical protein
MTPFLAPFCPHILKQMLNIRGKAASMAGAPDATMELYNIMPRRKKNKHVGANVQDN